MGQPESTVPKIGIDAKERIMDSLLVITDALVVARITKYPDADNIQGTIDYIMDRTKITNEELTCYNIEKLKSQNNKPAVFAITSDIGHVQFFWSKEYAENKMKTFEVEHPNTPFWVESLKIL